MCDDTRVRGDVESPNGDLQHQFERLFSRFRDGLYAYLLARTGHREVANDLLQDLFLRAWRAPDAWCNQGESAQRYWLFAVGKNIVIDHLRRKGLQTRKRALLHPESHKQVSPSAEEEVLVGETSKEIHRAVMELPDDLRIPLVMQTVGGLTSQDIGTLLDIPSGTVRYRLSIARRQLRTALLPGATEPRGPGG